MGMQEEKVWIALFWCNHDQPRIVSRLGNEGRWWRESAKMLAACIHLMRGTPYIYQGEEIGMTNPHYTCVDQYRDVESLNYYQILLDQGKTREETLNILGARSRDNSRTPMQWSSGENAGFSDHEAWIPAADNYRQINVEAQREDPASILNFYKRLIALRKENAAISRGRIAFLEEQNPDVLAFTRTWEDQEILVWNNLKEMETEVTVPEGWECCRKLLGNYEEASRNGVPSGKLILRPYETAVLEKLG